MHSDGEMARLLSGRRKILLALREYKKKTGYFPDSLSALQPDFLSEIPRDEASGQPFSYALHFEGYLLINGIISFRQTHNPIQEFVEKALGKYEEKFHYPPESLDILVLEFLTEIPRDETTGTSLRYVRLGPYPELTITQEDGKAMPCRRYDDIVWDSD